ncbi:hypothetical protein J41TS2_24770 [Bacillus sonorensis]|uniref:hypothetical protein n=1 Tax=Bacillus sonorensis TaxID=119858 RepID=UPI001B1451B3|nr:hypothetical protein [Bacillus sonorensis]GIN67056.1 hypothetical protein J41TS2_24770 [Bacillus sonorensis]
MGKETVYRGMKPFLKLASIKLDLEKAKKDFTNLLPPEYQEEFKNKSYLAGGAIYSLYNNQIPKDYDFFLTDESLVKELRRFFDNGTLKYKNGVKIGKYNDLILVYTDNAISIGDYQIITRWVGDPEDVIEEFDFKHNMFYYIDSEIKTLVDWSYLEDNKLRYNEKRARDICGTIIRIKKFVERGFTITNREVSKMLLKLHEVGFNDRELEILHANDERNDFGS